MADVVEAGVVIAALGVLAGVIAPLYARLAALESRERELWAWARRVVDLYYRHRRAGAPDPPDLPERK